MQNALLRDLKATAWSALGSQQSSKLRPNQQQFYCCAQGTYTRCDPRWGWWVRLVNQQTVTQPSVSTVSKCGIEFSWGQVAPHSLDQEPLSVKNQLSALEGSIRFMYFVYSTLKALIYFLKKFLGEHAPRPPQSCMLMHTYIQIGHPCNPPFILSSGYAIFVVGLHPPCHLMSMSHGKCSQAFSSFLLLFRERPENEAKHWQVTCTCRYYHTVTTNNSDDLLSSPLLLSPIVSMKSELEQHF